MCEDVKIRRFKPFIKELDSEHLRVLEEYEMKKGMFGSLVIRDEELGSYARRLDVATEEVKWAKTM